MRLRAGHLGPRALLAGKVEHEAVRAAAQLGLGVDAPVVLRNVRKEAVNTPR